MNRDQLSHLLRAVADATGETEILVIGSQAILGSLDEIDLPPETTMSMEADLGFFDDPEERKSDLVDGVVGELSRFHESFGYYGQGISLNTAVVPDGWRERLVPFEAWRPAPHGAGASSPMT